MTHSDMRRMNRILADLGRNQHGQALYKWCHSSELYHFVAGSDELVEKNGVFRKETNYAREPQLEESRWCLALWMAPKPYDEWVREFGSECPWPAQGSYWVTDIILHSGVEPNDQLTDDIVGKVKALRKRTDYANKGQAMREIYEHLIAGLDKRDEDARKFTGDWLTEKVPAFYNDPGKRGGSVSFGGI